MVYFSKSIILRFFLDKGIVNEVDNRAASMLLAVVLGETTSLAPH